MKTIAHAAMAAIEAGEAIVSGAVEITPVSTTTSDTGDTIPANVVVLTWWQKTFGGDMARMGLAFYGVDGVQLGDNHWAPYTESTSDWTERTLTVEAPSGTVTTRVYQDRILVSGAFIDGYIDDISMTVGGANVPLTNPDAETNTTVGWTDLSGTMYNPTPGHDSDRAFGGIGDSPAVAYQDVSVTTEDGGSTTTDGSIIRLWGGYGTLTIGGNVYQGVGASGLAQQNAGAVGGIAQGMTLGLSGIEPAALELMDGAGIKDASVVLYRLIFASDGKTLLDAHVFDRGRVDTVSTDETIGADAMISVAVESSARGLGRAGARMRADSDQRLIDAADGYFKHTAYAGQKTLYWGGKKPAIGLHG